MLTATFDAEAYEDVILRDFQFTHAGDVDLVQRPVIPANIKFYVAAMSPESTFTLT